MGRVLYGPRDWLAEHTDSRTRGAIAFWLLILLQPITLATYPFRNSVGVLWVISMAALDLALLAVLFAETPVETEINVEEVEINQ